MCLWLCGMCVDVCLLLIVFSWCSCSCLFVCGLVSVLVFVCGSVLIVFVFVLICAYDSFLVLVLECVFVCGWHVCVFVCLSLCVSYIPFMSVCQWGSMFGV